MYVRRQSMESFVLAGKARTVFRMVELMAKAEGAEREGKEKRSNSLGLDPGRSIGGIYGKVEAQELPPM